jgi:uncharacterized repeat protein (TIGR02543 family)
MFKTTYLWMLRALMVLTFFAATAAWADSLKLITSQSSQGANDSLNWSQLGADGTVLPASLNVQTANGTQVTVPLTGANSVVSVVCGNNPCSWTGGKGFAAADSLLWTSDAGNGGNGPVVLNFTSNVAGGGALIQADGPGQFTVQVQAYNGSTLLGSFNVNSDANGAATYIGVLDQTGPNITSLVFSITSCVTGSVCSDFGIDTISVNAPTANDYTLTVTTSGSGTVTSTDGFINCPGTCSHSYLVNSQVTLNATPASGWTFSGWSGACSGTGSCVVTMTQNLSVGATFTQPGYALLTVSTSGNGTVTSTDGFINCPGTCTHSYPLNTQVTLNAAPAQGWTFAGWSGACNGTGSCTVTMTQSLSVNAMFAGNALQLITVTPCRLVDTRETHDPILGGTWQNFIVPQLGNCGIPSTAAAYSLNVTVVPHGPLGYLTIWPAGQNQPLVSTLNSYDGRVKAVAAIVPAGALAAVSAYVTDTTDLILDIDGYFTTPSQQTLQFYTLPPCRVADTRGPNGPLGGPYLIGGKPRDFPVLQSQCGIPKSAQAYSFNFTAVPHGSLGYLTVWPTGQKQPVVSTLNAYGGQVTANAAIVLAGKDGEISAFAYNDTDLLIDINGYFAPPGQGGLSLYPVVPCRVLDTRRGKGAFDGTLSPPVDPVNSPCAVPSAAQAYVFNATVVPQGSLGYLTLWPDGGTQPDVSTLNAYDGAVTSNMAIVPAGNQGKVDAFAFGTTNLLLDISSYFAP